MAKIIIPPGFDLPIALEAAELVVQAYAQFNASKTGAKWSLPAEYLIPGLLSARAEGLLAKPEPFGFVAQNKTSGNVFVTFRGTDTLEDWLSNITIRQINHPWGAVEEGFWNLYQQCQESVHAAVKAAAGPQVIVKGHSLGGALATLAAADLAISGIAVKMYNFASPRTGSPAFAERFNQQIPVAWRAVNTEDLVATVPSRRRTWSPASLPMACSAF